MPRSKGKKVKKSKKPMSLYHHHRTLYDRIKKCEQRAREKRAKLSACLKYCNGSFGVQPNGKASSYSPQDKSSAALSSEEGSSKYDLSGGIDDGRANGSDQSQQYNYRAVEEKIGGKAGVCFNNKDKMQNKYLSTREGECQGNFFAGGGDVHVADIADAASVGRIVGEEGKDDGESNVSGRADGMEEGVMCFSLVGGSEHVSVIDEVEGKELLGGLVRGEAGLIMRGEGRSVRGGDGGLVRAFEGGLVNGGEGGFIDEGDEMDVNGGKGMDAKGGDGMDVNGGDGMGANGGDGMDVNIGDEMDAKGGNGMDVNGGDGMDVNSCIPRADVGPISDF